MIARARSRAPIKSAMSKVLPHLSHPIVNIPRYDNTPAPTVSLALQCNATAPSRPRLFIHATNTTIYDQAGSSDTLSAAAHRRVYECVYEYVSGSLFSSSCRSARHGILSPRLPCRRLRLDRLPWLLVQRLLLRVTLRPRFK